MTLHRNSALQAGVGAMFDRVLSELSLKMRHMQMDQAELACLKAIILFNAGQLINVSTKIKPTMLLCMKVYVSKHHME